MAEIDFKYGKNGGVKHAKNDNGKDSLGKEKDGTAKRKVKDRSGKGYKYVTDK